MFRRVTFKVIQDLYNEAEQDLDKTLLGLSCIVGKDYGLIKIIKRVRQYYDEPKFWYYSSDLNDSFLKNDGRHFQSKASGTSLFSQKEALLKCLGESIERYCNFIFLDETTSYTRSIKSMKEKFIDPRLMSAFSKKQLLNKKFKRFRIDKKFKLRWTPCISLFNGDVYQIPSQFIYLSYPYLKNEQSIYQGISTGVAGGANLSAATVRGICEIIERDAFMIFYLNKLKPSRINLEGTDNVKIKKLLAISIRYKLDIFALDITTDLGVPTVATITVNHSGLGKAISIGLKCDFDVVKAIIGSVEEALHTRSWLRSSYESKPQKIEVKDLKKNSNIRSRGLLWYGTETLKNLNFWLTNLKTKDITSTNREFDSGEKLKKLIEIFRRKNYEVYYKDITLQEIKNLNYFVVKVIIPKMQPLYLNENYPLLGCDRLYTIPKQIGYNNKAERNLNKFPHPFL